VAPVYKRYRAFISYSQKDTKQAQALHRALENYRVPLGIAPDAIKSKRRLLGKFFRDAEDMSAASDISATVRGAIEDSESLVVVCSPRSAGSRWVDTEVQHFRRIGRGDRIFAVIVDGVPNSGDPETECFPPSLRLDAGPDLHPDEMPVEPVGIDLRQDGMERVCARIASGLLGVPFDQLWQRRRREAIRQWWVRGAIAAGLVLAAGLVVMGVQSRGERQVAQARSDALANLAKEANDNQRFEEAQRYALAGMRGRDALFAGFTPRHARAELMRALASGQAEAVINTHGGPVLGVAVSSDGTRILSWSDDGVAKLWDRRTLELRHELRGHVAYIWDGAFSADGRRVATASADNSAQLWDAETGRRVATLVEGKLLALAGFSGDGRFLATATDEGVVHLWNPSDGKRIRDLVGPSASLNGAAFSPDSSRLAAVGEDGAVRLWSLDRTGPPVVVRRGNDPLSLLAFSDNSTVLATASDSGTVRALDGKTGQVRASMYGLNGAITALDVSPDGRFVAAGDAGGEGLIWALARPREAAPLIGHTDLIRNLAFSPDGATILTTSHDESAMLWDGASGGEIAVLKSHRAPLEGGVFTPDGAQVLTASADRSVRLWRVASPTLRTVIAGHPDAVNFAAFDPAGRRVLSESDAGRAIVSDATSGAEVFRVGDQNSRVSAAVFNDDGSRLVTSGPEGHWRVLDAASGGVLGDFIDESRRISALLFRPGTREVLIAGGGGVTRLMRTSDGAPVRAFEGHDIALARAVFSSDGARLATASRRHVASPWDIRIWDAATGVMIAHLDDANSESALAFSPDGSRLLTASIFEARIWDVRSAKVIATLAGHDGNILAATLSPDGTRVATASEDKTARIWDASNGRPLVALVGNVAMIVGVQFSPDGSRVLTASYGGSARVWDAATGREMMQVQEPAYAPLRQAAFSPDGRSIVTASEGAAARIWDVGITLLADAQLVARACESGSTRTLARFPALELERARSVHPRTPSDACQR